MSFMRDLGKIDFIFLFQRNYIIKCKVYTSSVEFNANQTSENPFEDFCCRGHPHWKFQTCDREWEKGREGRKFSRKSFPFITDSDQFIFTQSNLAFRQFRISFAFALHTSFVPCHSSFAFESFVENCECNSITVVGIKNNDFIAVISPILNFQSIVCTDFTRAPAQSNENSFIFVIDTIFFHFISFPPYAVGIFAPFLPSALVDRKDGNLFSSPDFIRLIHSMCVFYFGFSLFIHTGCTTFAFTFLLPQ